MLTTSWAAVRDPRSQDHGGAHPAAVPVRIQGCIQTIQGSHAAAAWLAAT